MIVVEEIRLSSMSKMAKPWNTAKPLKAIPATRKLRCGKRLVRAM